MVAIIKTKPGASDFFMFENFPSRIYPANSVRFKQVETIPSEFLESCYVLTVNGKPQARAALYINAALRFEGKKSFCIGNYEAVEDISISEKLLTVISQEAKKNGAQFLIGPMDGSTWNNYRFSNHHNNPTFFLEPYHHLYYNKQFLNFGFKPIAQYFSCLDTDMHHGNEMVLKRKQEFLNEGVVFRKLNLKNFEHELETIHDFNTLAFKANFLYSPISKAKFIKKYTAAKKVIDPEFVLLAEDAAKNLIGYIFCINDLFNTQKKSIIIKTIARHPDKKWMGLGHVMVDMVYQKLPLHDYKAVIHAFIFEAGTSTGLSKKLSGEIFKNYTLYGKEIN